MSKGPVTGLLSECRGDTEDRAVISLSLLLCKFYIITYIITPAIEFVLQVDLVKNFRFHL